MKTCFSATSVILGIMSCDKSEVPDVATAPAQCPTVSLDDMTGEWIKYDRNQVIKDYRFQILRSDAGITMHYVGGGFTKRVFDGIQRGNDIQFTERLNPDQQTRFSAGESTRRRLYTEPHPADCSLRVNEVTVTITDGAEKERTEGGFATYVEFPSSGPQLTFDPCTDPLFLGDAAKNHDVAQAQIQRNGQPDAFHQLGPQISVAMWTDTQNDGDLSCTYDMDLFFDDAHAKDKDGNNRLGLPATTLDDGQRHWLISDWYAPYSGNHNFEVYRYRTCDDGIRTLLGVACLEAILQ